MQKPFQISPEMLEEVDEQISTTLLKDAYAPVGPSVSKTGILRRPLDTLHSDSATSGSADDQLPAEDAINPSHYRKHPSGIECIEVTRHMNFNTGNAIKYIWRYLDKGDPVENLKKAQWYIDDEIRRLEGKR